MKPYAILAIDQGTTGTRATIYNNCGRVLSTAYQEFRQIFPRPGWVEHSPNLIWKSVLCVINLSLSKAKIKSNALSGIGITNQRETTVLWNKKTGKPVCNAIVWQDRRTTDFCDKLKKKRCESVIRKKTGLVLDPYFSATKINWILKNKPNLRKDLKSGNILFGTIDAWLLWKLTGGVVHATDYTNASRTLLLNIHTKKWDSELLNIFKVPKNILPEIKNSGDFFGKTVSLKGLRSGIPINAVLGDQQAALYGHDCTKSGEIKNTYGTGCFVVLNMGSKRPKVSHGILTTLACNAKGEPVYALEGSIFIGGAVMQWVRDGLGFLENVSESESISKKIKDSHGVLVIPAFAGLGAPYWNPHVRGVITGLTRGVRKEHIVRASLESIAEQSADVIDVMKKKHSGSIRDLRVDGGASENKFLMQFQADLLNIPIKVSERVEMTSWGVAKLAGKSLGFWKDINKLAKKESYRVFLPRMSSSDRKKKRKAWRGEMQNLLSGANISAVDVIP